MLCGVRYDDVMTFFVKTVKTRAKKDLPLSTTPEA